MSIVYLSLPDQMHQKLVLLKNKTGLTMSEHARRAFDEYFVKHLTEEDLKDQAIKNSEGY